VYTQAEIKAIAHWARDRKVWIVADEIYRRIHYGRAQLPPSSICRTTCSSASW